MAVPRRRSRNAIHAMWRPRCRAEASYGDDVLQLVIATGCLTKLVGNPEITRYLAAYHPEFLDKFRAIITGGLPYRRPQTQKAADQGFPRSAACLGLR